MSSGSLNIPPGGMNGTGNGHPHLPSNGMARFDGPRSPPGKQSTFDLTLLMELLFPDAELE
jgi:hypothetical protein